MASFVHHGNAFVMGWPVDHSLSPIIHNYWMKKHHIEAHYTRWPVKPEELGDAIKSLRQQQTAGVNLTVPHKELVLPMLDRVDPTAQAIGAVNTVVKQDHHLVGYNTDAYGFWHSVKNEMGETMHDKTAVILGAGGAARAVAYALKEADAAHIYIVNRTVERAEKLANEIGGVAEAASWDQLPKLLPHAALLVNTTTLGMKNQPALEIDLAPLGVDSVVCDIVYAPLETALLRQARDRGLQAVDGLGMLLYQAQKAFSLWYDVLPEIDANLRETLEQEVND